MAWRTLLLLIVVVSIGCDDKSRTRLPAVRRTEFPSSEQVRPSNSDASAIADDLFQILNHSRLIDLTYAFDERTVYWPNASGFKLTVDSAKVTDKGYYYAANSFAAAEHGGTHIDAPIHFYKDRTTLDKIPLDRLVGPGVVVDVTRQCAEDADYQIGVGDLQAWEEEHGAPLVDVIVLLRTGYGRFWPVRERYMGTNERGAEAIAKLHFPGLDPIAAQWLVEHRQIKAIGIDTPSIDYGQSTLFESHVTLFQHNVPAMENVAQLDQLPTSGFAVIALPMKIRGGSGGPTRILAVLPEE